MKFNIIPKLVLLLIIALVVTSFISSAQEMEAQRDDLVNAMGQPIEKAENYAFELMIDKENAIKTLQEEPIEDDIKVIFIKSCLYFKDALGFGNLYVSALTVIALAILSIASNDSLRDPIVSFLKYLKSFFWPF